MKKSWLRLIGLFTIVTMLTGCDPLLVLDPKGPQAQVQAKDIMLSIGIMSFIVLVVFVILAYMLMKFRASKQSPDYKPPHIKGSTMVEVICVGIPVLIVAYMSIISVQSNYKVESTPEKYKDEKPLVIYASTSNWKWHFSYPEEGVETVNYVNLPVDRPIEFKLYSFGPITSFWIPQLAGQKYAMSDMLTTIHLAADEVGSFMGRNSNFNGRGFAEMEFEAQSMTKEDFDKWVADVKAKEKPLTEEKFDELLKAEHVGRQSFSSTHLEFSPAPMEHGKNMKMGDMDHSDMSEEDMNNEHSGH